MLFLLDNDVDAAVGSIVRRARHGCVTAAQIGLADGSDEDLSLWADNRSAVVITHDREYFRRRTRNTFGRHVRLKCRDWEAVKVTERHLGEIVALVPTRDAVVILATLDEVKLLPNAWN